ncbi:MAG: transporter substrate-binding domain-containing protein [Bacteroidetes bacterium]|nr:transporter substrate-binding domain-containing protein [Bacteroidota bacterium]
MLNYLFSLKRIRKYVSLLAAVTAIFILTATSCKQTEINKLSYEEREWLASNNGTIRLGVYNIWPPIGFTNEEGNYCGISAEYIKCIEEKFEFEFDIIYVNNWNELLQMVANREVDVVNVINRLSEYEEHLTFTSPFLRIPAAIVTRDEHGTIRSVDDLAGLRIGGVEGYSSTEFILQNYPEYNISSIPTDFIGIQEVAFNHLDAVITPMPIASYYLKREGFTNLLNRGLGFSYELAFASRNDQPILNSILNKGLEGISESERSAIYNKWLTQTEPNLWDTRTFWVIVLTIIGAFVLIVTVVLIWNKTLKKQVEQRTKEMNKELNERLKIEQELIVAKEKAEKSDRIKSEFLAQMSHEIRTPIGAILSFSSLLREQLEGKIGEDLQDGFGILHRAGMRVMRTMDLILNMSEMQAGTYDFQPRIIDLEKDILPNIEFEMMQAVKDKKLDLIITKDVDSTKLLADDYTVNQILTNLIDNAIKYTNEGRVEVNIKRNFEKKLTVEVLDTGVGISKEYLPDIFEPFTQEEQGYTRRFEGNGLGLSLVKKYCELNNADIFVESVKGKGSKFTVVFPSN